MCAKGRSKVRRCQLLLAASPSRSVPCGHLVGPVTACWLGGRGVDCCSLRHPLADVASAACGVLPTNRSCPDRGVRSAHSELTDTRQFLHSSCIAIIKRVGLYARIAASHYGDALRAESPDARLPPPYFFLDAILWNRRPALDHQPGGRDARLADRQLNVGGLIFARRRHHQAGRPRRPRSRRPARARAR